MKNIKLNSILLVLLLILSLTACNPAFDDIPQDNASNQEDVSSNEETNGGEIKEEESKRGTTMFVDDDGESESQKDNKQHIQDFINKAKGENTELENSEDEENEDNENEDEENTEKDEDDEEKIEKKNVEDDDLVNVEDYIPGIFVSLPYATSNNFCNVELYVDNDAYLRYGTVKKLLKVQEAVSKDGYSLMIWDGYRPRSVQEQMWEIVPDETYVANPYNGGSNHNRGNTVDLTLVNSNGEAIPMPTDFDDFTDKADRDYSDVSEDQARNAKYLENVMKNNGFKPYSAEWWHFTDTKEYPFVDYDNE